ncbi:MAG: tetratricopeptide repeat protein [Porphyromonas sp.]|nr:tetratricopeptide repeat protein [Porphyromonas sp.]
MKKTLLFTIAMIAMSAWTSKANNIVSSIADSAPNAAIDTTECRKNVSYFKIHAKTNNFQDAYDFWLKVYKNCPDMTKDIYIVGPQILKWKIADAKTQEEKTKYINQLMEVYDTRMKYFANDPQFGPDYILASKVMDYIETMAEKADYEMIYNWLKDIVAEKKEKTDYMALNFYLYSSMVKVIKNPDHKEQYINEYLTISKYYEDALKRAHEKGDMDRVRLYTDLKTAADTQFASSGAASCDMLQKIYGSKIEENKDNKEYLDNVIALLRRVNCLESDIYFRASEFAYAISPSAEAALGLAKRAHLNKDRARANQLFEEAAALSTSSDQRADIYYIIAQLAYEQGQYSRARQYANKAMDEKSGFGSPLILIANAYAATANSIFPDDAVKARIVYCLAVDKLERARSIDPSVSAEAGRLIARYRSYFPSKEDVFMHPDLKEGQSIAIGGWIGETTTIRVK